MQTSQHNRAAFIFKHHCVHKANGTDGPCLCMCLLYGIQFGICFWLRTDADARLVKVGRHKVDHLLSLGRHGEGGDHDVGFLREMRVRRSDNMHVPFAGPILTC